MSLQKNKITRTFSHPDEFYSENIMTEYRQCIDEGLDAAPYKQLFEAVAAMPMSATRTAPPTWHFATRAYRTPKTESTVKCISRHCLHCAPSKAIL